MSPERRSEAFKACAKRNRFSGAQLHKPPAKPEARKQAALKASRAPA